jgi:hypothetical protein
MVTTWIEVSVTTWIEISAILLGPLAAVLITVWLQRRQTKHDPRLAVLTTLVSLRHAVLSHDSVRALNLIDLVFHDDSAVRRLWHAYFDMLCNVGLNNPLAGVERGKKHAEMITEMAKCIGLGASVTALDMQRVYNPVGLDEQQTRQLEIQQELLRVLRASSAVQMQPKDAGQK